MGIRNPVCSSIHPIGKKYVQRKNNKYPVLWQSLHQSLIIEDFENEKK